MLPPRPDRTVAPPAIPFGGTPVPGGPSADAEAPFESTPAPGREPRLSEHADRPSVRWIGWRLRLLVVWVLLGCVGLVAGIRFLAATPSPDAVWVSDRRGGVELASTEDPTLAPYLGQGLERVTGGGDDIVADETLLGPQTPRWIVDDALRERRLAANARLRRAFAAPDAQLVFRDGSTVALRPLGRSFASLPLVCWLLTGFGFALYLVAMTVLLAHPCLRNVVYALIALCQSTNLLMYALDQALPFGPTPNLAHLSWPLPFALDWITAAAMVNAACLHPRRLPAAGAIVGLTWATTVLLVAHAARGSMTDIWTWGQWAVTGYGVAAILLFSWSNRIQTHPLAIALRRFGVVMLGSWVAVSLAVAVGQPEVDPDLTPLGVTAPVVWYLFLASLLLLVPFLARSQDFMREFALLAVISTVATSLDLVFVAVFSLGQFTSLALALFAALAVYGGLRQWMMNWLIGANVQTTEKTFERLYRTAREVEAHPERTPALLGRLLAEVFDPIEVQDAADRPLRSQVVGAGSGLRVPVPVLDPPTLGDGSGATAGSIALRYARRGRRLFSEEDARLADRIVEQLRRAVGFDRAVEHGRSEERLRLAQDLHDDIGARLLTLMYRASSPEMEDYARHTLQDLKTLTRGLSASGHRLSDAAAEWKTDIAQRTSLAGIELQWQQTFEDDLTLTVVQWSAVTRILRELVTNVIAHAGARRIEIDLGLEGDTLGVRVADDGQGSDPAGWSPGLGLSGIRKRVMQLGGKVEWERCWPQGIECRVQLPGLAAGDPVG